MRPSPTSLMGEPPASLQAHSMLHQHTRWASAPMLCISCSLHARSRQTSISSADVLGLHSVQMVSKSERQMHVACLYWTHFSTTHHTSVQGVAEKREVQILLLRSPLVAAAPIRGCTKRSLCCGSAGGQCASVLSQRRLAAGSLHRHKVAIYWLHRTATGVRVEVLKMHRGLHLEAML